MSSPTREYQVLARLDLWDCIEDNHLPAELRRELAAAGLLSRLQDALGGNRVYEELGTVVASNGRNARRLAARKFYTPAVGVDETDPLLAVPEISFTAERTKVPS